MKSMTGFGRSVAECGDFRVCVDVSSVNKKGLELSVSLPRQWQPLERLVAAKVREFYSRGKVNVAFKVDFKNRAADIFADTQALKSAFGALKKACEEVGAEFAPTSDTLMKLAETFGESEGNSDWESAWQVLEPALIDALKKSDQMREREGENLKSDLLSRLNLILELTLSAERESKGTAKKYRDKLLERLSELGLELRLDDERLLKELCIFADKCDTAEETTRLKSHIAQFSAAAEEREPAGRKMDFICQEMGREINTTASKANNLELTKIAISLKNELERVREQIQNIE